MLQRPVPWPNGAKVACAITLDMDADSLVHIHHGQNALTKLCTTSMLQYGPKVAIPRILDTFERYGMKQSFFIPAWCIENYPHTVEAIVKAGHEVGFHGYIHEAPNQLSADQEQHWMGRSIEIIEKHTGQRPRGNRAPLYHMSDQTPDLLVKEGLVYDSSLMGDEVPYILKTGAGELVELPVSWATDDWPPYVHCSDLDYQFQIMPPERAMEIFMAEFEALRAHPGGLWIGVWHPFVSGRLSRWARVEKMIDTMMQTGDVWFATMEEIARHVQSVRADGSYEARVDTLPYYSENQVPSDLQGKA
ncbi:MAG: polysaccharide deacetylase [Pseudomonadota bacterium]